MWEVWVMEPVLQFRIKMTEHPASGDARTDGWGKGIRTKGYYPDFSLGPRDGERSHSLGREQ